MKLRIPNPYAIFGFGGLLLLAGMFYNAGLAFLNAHIMTIGTLHVALTEAVILAVSVVYIASKIRTFPNIMPPVVFLVFMGMMFLFVSFLNEHFFPKALRDMILVAVFFMIGGTLNERSLLASFRFITAAILSFLLIEGFLTELYVWLFEPANYYTNTRGLTQSEHDKSGLFQNAQMFKGRFSFGVFETHRLSSLFLEQVSLANFSIILAVLLCAFWDGMKKWDRALYLVTIILILLTNNSRTATVISAMLLAGYFIFPLLPRYTHMLCMPLVLILAAIFFHDPAIGTDKLTGDNLQGRIGFTMAHMATMGSSYFTGGTLNEIYKTFDSGFTYLIMTQTVFGLIAFWLFTGLAVPSSDASTKRFNCGMAMYIYTNLLIGAAIFSIKVSAPIFLIAGYFHYKKYRKDLQNEITAVTGR